MPSLAITSSGIKRAARLGLSAACLALAMTGCEVIGWTPLSSGGGASMSSGLVVTRAGQAGTAGFSDGTGMGAVFDAPRGVATDGTTLYIADTMNSCIRQMVLATGAVTTIAGMPGVEGSQDGPGASALFDRPYGLALDVADSRLYVADSYNYTIRMVSLAEPYAVTTVAGKAGTPGHIDAPSGPGTSARFRFCQAIAFDATNSRLYVADSSDATIRRITISGSLYEVSTIAGQSLVTGSSDGTGTASQFNYPCGVAVNPAGTLVFVADTLNNTLREIDASSVVTTIAGTAGVVGSQDGTTATFYEPRGLATDSSGSSLFVADSLNDTIREYNINTHVTLTLAGRARLPNNADGQGSSALFSFPCGVAAGEDFQTLQPSLYVGDTGNDTIREIIQ